VVVNCFINDVIPLIIGSVEIGSLAALVALIDCINAWYKLISRLWQFYFTELVYMTYGYGISVDM
jgi:hypothetical protein